MSRPPVSQHSDERRPAADDRDHPTDGVEDLLFDANDLLVGELTAAMVDAQRTSDDALPPALAERIRQAGETIVRTHRDAAAAARPLSAVPPAPVAGPASSVRALRTMTQWSGWLAAAALAVVMVRQPAPAGPVDAPPVVSEAGETQRLHRALLADSTAVRLAWTPTDDSTGQRVQGDVVWSPSQQRGVMRFVGLVPNDRARWQYQLWIFDKQRDERYPVDGGVFDIDPGTGEVLVPIRARLPVGEAVLFAVTVERAGGVVVSTRERIAALAKL